MRKIGSALVVGLMVAGCGGTSSNPDAGDAASSSSVAEHGTVVGTTAPAATDEPATVGTTTLSEALATRLVGDGEWDQVAADEPWVGSVVGIDALPGGGYVAVTGSGLSAVMWSPDGVGWFEGDPDGDLEFPSSNVHPSGSLAVTGDRVVVVDGVDFSTHVPLAIGDPRTGEWDGVVLDYSALDGRAAGVAMVSLAASDEEVLVAASSAHAEGSGVTEVVTWIVDPATRSWETTSFPTAATPQSPTHEPLVAWIDGRWILFADEDVPGSEGGGQRSALWTSPDGLEWSQTDLPDDMATVGLLTTSPRGVAVVTAEKGAGGTEEMIWYSIDGLEWAAVPYEHPAHPVPLISAGTYGFVTVGEHGLQVFADDSEVYGMFAPFDEEMGGELDELGDVGASSGDTLLVLSDNEPGLWLYSAVTLTPVEWSASNWGASMIVEVSPLDVQDVASLGASLIWEETTITLTSDTRGRGRITIRDVGVGYVHIGDIFGFDERPDMEAAAANYGPPISACIYVETVFTVRDYCAPLTLVDD